MRTFAYVGRRSRQDSSAPYPARGTMEGRLPAAGAASAAYTAGVEPAAVAELAAVAGPGNAANRVSVAGAPVAVARAPVAATPQAMAAATKSEASTYSRGAVVRVMASA